MQSLSRIFRTSLKRGTDFDVRKLESCAVFQKLADIAGYGFLFFTNRIQEYTFPRPMKNAASKSVNERGSYGSLKKRGENLTGKSCFRFNAAFIFR